ncbi:MAG TPA: GIY-YIG nuclease family protein [Candidatus Paceibacterota bacterium]|nr:GIY-YIG nuclease family protein [Candidatus Paceibacterota bacterium]
MITKAEILEKIREWAENNGKTPSEKTFYEYTGIGIYDLQKCGYAYYGELVQEAGLPPNKFDKTKYSEEQLYDMFIKVLREKGRWPTKGDLDVKHHIDSNFPPSATFYKKLGLVSIMAERIIKYLKNKPGYEDVITACKAVIDKSNKADEVTEAKNNERIGEVYLYKSGNYYKIGKTFDIVRRGKEIRLELPEKLNLIHSIKTDDPSGVELYWHKRFESKRKNGEWFNLNTADRTAFKRWKRIY